MQPYKITAKSPANVQEFVDLVNSAGGQVTSTDGNVIVAQVPDANAFTLRIRDNPRVTRDENRSMIGTGPLVQPPQPDARDIALAAEQKAHEETAAALAKAQTDLAAAHAAREAAEAGESDALSKVAALTQQLADATPAAPPAST